MDILVKRTYKYRIYPSRSQTSRLENQFSMCRHLWNWSLLERVNFYEHSGGRLTYEHQAMALPILKQNRPWYRSVHSQVLQNVLKRLQSAFDNFFRRVKEGSEAPGFPKFKKRGNWTSITYPQYHAVPAEEISVPKIGKIRMKLHRNLPGKAKVKTLTLKKEGGKWFACFSFEDLLETEPKHDLFSAVGIDMGLISLYHDTDDRTVQTPKFFRQMEKKLRRLHRRFSNAEKGTAKVRILKALHKCYHRIRCRRLSFLHGKVNELLAKYDIICIEDLRIANMTRRPKPKQDEETGRFLPNGAAAKAGLNKSILDACWGEFFHILRYKAEALCKVVVAVPPRFTSQKCSACGRMIRKSLSIRTHQCACGYVADRDLNAALNIKRLGLETLFAGLAN